MSSVVIGNLTADPELRFTQSGKPVASLTVAVNRKKGDDEHTSFIDVTAWDSLAENVSESLQKGDRVVVTGRLEQRSWETPEGDRRSKLEVVADEIGPSLRWATASVQKNERRQ